MSIRTTHRRPIASAFFTATLLLTFALAPSPVTAQSRTDATTIFLVRHAERATDDPQDPGLTPAGRARATELAWVLGNAGITAVFSTPFRRTMDTAKPIASRAGVEIESYDPRSQAAMRAFIERLRTMHGRIVVSGHSNTTPALVEALGGDVVVPMTEADYDRLYIITIGVDGKVTSALLHYGEPSGGHRP